MLNRSFGAMHPFQIPRGEDVKTKLWCDASFKFQELKKCDNEASVRCFLQIPGVEGVETDFGAMHPSNSKS